MGRLPVVATEANSGQHGVMSARQGAITYDAPFFAQKKTPLYLVSYLWRRTYVKKMEGQLSHQKIKQSALSGAISVSLLPKNYLQR